jgi:hypothetical protein
VTLTDAEGRPLVRMRSAAVGSGHEIDLAPGVPVDTAAAAMVAELPGWHVSPGPELAAALAERGARLGRHAHLHSRDLRAEPPPAAWAEAPPPPGTRFGPVRSDDADLGEAMDAAYPVGHPDRMEVHPAKEFVRVAEGRVLGPLLPCSTALVAADGRGCAAAVLTGRDGTAPWGGPWLTVMFRHPVRGPRGSGRSVLARSLAQAAADGLPSLSLVVTEGNPARRLYDTLGIGRIRSTVNVELP